MLSTNINKHTYNSHRSLHHLNRGKPIASNYLFAVFLPNFENQINHQHYRPQTCCVLFLFSSARIVFRSFFSSFLEIHRNRTLVLRGSPVVHCIVFTLHREPGSQDVTGEQRQIESIYPPGQVKDVWKKNTLGSCGNVMECPCLRMN